MKRIDVIYGGEQYSIGGSSIDELRSEIEEGLQSGEHWLEVNAGEGAPRRAYLLITAGVPVAVIPIPDDYLDYDDGSEFDESAPWEREQEIRDD